MSNKVLLILLLVTIILVLLIFYGESTYTLLVEHKCRSEANDLSIFLREYYEENGMPYIGGISPEMRYDSCMERFGFISPGGVCGGSKFSLKRCSPGYECKLIIECEGCSGKCMPMD